MIILMSEKINSSYTKMKESIWLEEIKKKGWMIEIGVTIILP